ncbi:MAG: hypothetical protein AB7G11_00350 [Phycisphaerales bacterium]
MLTLWDLIEPVFGRKPRKREKKPLIRQAVALTAPTRSAARREAPPNPRPSPATDGRAGASISRSSEPARARYDRIVESMLATYDIRVRKWRSGMSGIAWYVTYRDGRISRLIESPRPKGPMSIAVFLHEVGHHAIGFNRYKPRCLEEYHAWTFAIAQMELHGLNITDGVRYRMALSLWYAVDKARRRGLQQLPPELEPYRSRPSKPAGRR